MACKAFWSVIQSQNFSNDKVMSHLIMLQISTRYTFSNKKNKALKWQIWKCKLGWFSPLRQSHIVSMLTLAWTLLLKQTHTTPTHAPVVVATYVVIVYIVSTA